MKSGVSNSRSSHVASSPCPYCMRPMRLNTRGLDTHPTADHLEPRATTHRAPTLMVCERCNTERDRLTLEEWAAKLEAANDYRHVHVARIADLYGKGMVQIVNNVAVLPLSHYAQVRR